MCIIQKKIDIVSYYLIFNIINDIKNSFKQELT